MLHKPSITPRHFNRLLAAPAAVTTALLVLAPWLAVAQDVVPVAAGARTWVVEPSVSLRQTFTDNYRLQSNKESDAITEATAGVRVTANAGLLRGYLDYALTGQVNARHSDANELRHYLSAVSTAELVQGVAFVDMRASYSQQATSAFGSKSLSRALDSSNVADVATISVVPRLRGRLGGVARYEARVSVESTRAKGTSAGDVDLMAAALHLDGDVRGSRLSWAADASHNSTDYLAGRRTYNDRLGAKVSYQVTRELSVGVTGGQERTDLISQGGETNATWGAMVGWRPSERTALSATAEKRFFGNAHSVTFTHRTPRTVWILSDVRDVSTSSAQGLTSLGSAYDLLFRLFASAQPDTVQRDVMVRNFLKTNGINPRANVIDGFLASAVTLQNTQAMSVALVGARNTVTLRASASRSERADQVVTTLDDLSTTRKVRERGISLDWAHRLTPKSSINLAGSYQRSEGDLASQQTTLKAITAVWSSPLGARSTMSAGARHARFHSSSAPYTENAVFGAIQLAF